MIADDEPAVRALIRSALERDGVEIVEAGDGERALELDAAGTADLVVLDWLMPGLSAPEVLTELKQRDASRPVVMLSAVLDSRHAGLARVLGADAFLSKPFRRRELLETVERLLA